MSVLPELSKPYQALEHFFLTVGQNNFGNKIPCLLLSPKCIRTNFQSSIIYRFLDDLRRGNLRNSVERKIFHYLVNYILNFLAKRHRFIPKVGHSKSTFFSMGKVLCTKKHRIPNTKFFSSLDRIKIVLNFSCYKL